MNLSEYTLHNGVFSSDSSKRNLNCIHLNSGKKYGPIPNGQSSSMKGEYEAIALVLKKYIDQWVICVYVKII